MRTTGRIWQHVSRSRISHEFLLIFLDLDDPEAYHGGPAAVQIVGEKFSEERLLILAQIVVDALEKYNYGASS